MVILLTTWVVVKLEKKDEVKLAFIFCTHRWQIDTPPPPCLPPLTFSPSNLQTILPFSVF